MATHRQILEEQRLASNAQIDANRPDTGKRKPHNPAMVIFAINAIGGIVLFAGITLLIIAVRSKPGSVDVGEALLSTFAGFILFGFASIIALLREIRDSAAK